jgi:hypothetical protein
MVLVSKPKRPTSIQHRRRTGQHHKQSPHYARTYWPYLPLALMVGLGLMLNTFWGNAHKSVLGYATDMSINGLLQQTNAARANNGSLGALALNSALDSAAQAKANDMASRDYWSHNTPDGATPWTFILNAGYHYQTAGENLAYGFDSSDATVTAWMNSPEHRDNILNTTYKDVGFGIANSNNYQGTGPETIVVAMYGSPQAQASAPQANAAPVASKPSNPAPAESTLVPIPAPASTPTAAAKPKDANVAPTTVGAAKQADKDVSAKSVSRIQLLSGGNAPWSMFAVSAIATVSVAIFFLRHGLFWHRALVKGEAFIIRHKLFDIVLVGVAVLGFVLSRSAGVIH